MAPNPTLKESMDMIFEKYNDLLVRLSDSNCTNGCTCAECRAENFYREFGHILERFD